MEKNFKLKATRLFYDAVAKRQIPVGVMFFTDKERALALVSGGFADIIERPQESKVDNKKEEVKEVKQVKVEQPKKVVAKPKAKAKK